MTIHDITRLIVRLWVFIFIIQKRQNERGRRTNRLPQTVLSVFLFLHFYSLYFFRFRRLTATPTIAAPKNRIYRPIRLSSPVFVERVLRSVPTAFSVLFLSRLFYLSVSSVGRIILVEPESEDIVLTMVRLPVVLSAFNATAPSPLTL